MNKAKYLLLGLLLFSLVFVTAQEDDLFGGGGDGGESLFDEGGGGDPFGGDQGGDPFGGGDQGSDDPFGGGDQGGDDPFGSGNSTATTDTTVDTEVEAGVDAEIGVGVDAEAATDAGAQAEDYQDPVFTYSKIPVHPERRVIDFYIPSNVVSADVTFLSSIEVEEQDQEEIDIAEFRVGFAHMLSVSDNFYISIGLRNEVYDIKIENFNNVLGNDEDETLYGIEVPIGFHFLLNDQLMISLEGAPGAYTDFQGSFDERDLQIYGGLRVTYAISPTLALIGGAYAGPDVTGYQLVPFGGLIWKPDPLLSAEIIIPFHAKLTLNFHDFPISLIVFYESLYFKHFRLDEDSSLVRANGGNQEDDFQYESMRAGVGVRYTFTKGVALEAIIGGTFDGKFDANKDDGLDRSLEGSNFDGDLFAKIGLSINSSFFEN